MENLKLSTTGSRPTFPFLRLPLELRQGVYQWALKVYIRDKSCANIPKKKNYPACIDCIGLLRVNRQIHREASEKFAQLNRFVHLVAEEDNILHDIVTECDFPIVARGYQSSVMARPPSLVAYKHFALKITAWNYIDSEAQKHLVFLADPSLDCLWKALANGGNILPLQLRRSSSLHVELPNSFGSPAYRQMLEQELLEPLIALCWGFSNFKVLGTSKAGSQESENVFESIRWKTGEEFVIHLQNLQQTSAKHLSLEKWHDALKTANQALSDFNILSWSGKGHQMLCETSNEIKEQHMQLIQHICQDQHLSLEKLGERGVSDFDSKTGVHIPPKERRRWRR